MKDFLKLINETYTRLHIVTFNKTHNNPIELRYNETRLNFIGFIYTYYNYWLRIRMALVDGTYSVSSTSQMNASYLVVIGMLKF